MIRHQLHQHSELAQLILGGSTATNYFDSTSHIRPMFFGTVEAAGGLQEECSYHWHRGKAPFRDFPQSPLFVPHHQTQIENYQAVEYE